jgi:transposase IS116/IS110/IS902 family protein
VASHWVARLGDEREIHNARQIAGFLGLVAAEDSTGDQVAGGPITRTGDNRLRNKPIQSAWTAVRKDPERRQFYRPIYSRHPKPLAAHKALGARARKLLPCFDPGGDRLPQGTPRHAAERPGKTLEGSLPEAEAPGLSVLP